MTSYSIFLTPARLQNSIASNRVNNNIDRHRKFWQPTNYGIHDMLQQYMAPMDFLS